MGTQQRIPPAREADVSSISREGELSLAQEKEKLEHGHRLEKRRIWLDKCLLAVLIGFAGFLGNWIFEDYKSDLAKTQFLLETRLEALKQIRDAYGVLVHHSFAKTVDVKSADAASYGKDVRTFMQAINKWGFLFSDQFTRELAHYAWIHQALAEPAVTLEKRNWGFVMAISQAFDASTRTAVNVEVLGTEENDDGPRFRLRMWEPEEVEKKGVSALFLDNLKTWEEARKRKATKEGG
jgi:hypothetical protein